MRSYDKVPPIKKQKLHQANSSSINFLTFMPLENLDSPISFIVHVFKLWEGAETQKQSTQEQGHRGLSQLPDSCEGPVLTTVPLTR